MPHLARALHVLHVGGTCPLWAPWSRGRASHQALPHPPPCCSEADTDELLARIPVDFGMEGGQQQHLGEGEGGAAEGPAWLQGPAPDVPAAGRLMSRGEGVGDAHCDDDWIFRCVVATPQSAGEGRGGVFAATVSSKKRQQSLNQLGCTPLAHVARPLIAAPLTQSRPLFSCVQLCPRERLDGRAAAATAASGAAASVNTGTPASHGAANKGREQAASAAAAAAAQ